MNLKSEIDNAEALKLAICHTFEAANGLQPNSISLQEFKVGERWAYQVEHSTLTLCVVNRDKVHALWGLLEQTCHLIVGSGSAPDNDSDSASDSASDDDLDDDFDDNFDSDFEKEWVLPHQQTCNAKAVHIRDEAKLPPPPIPPQPQGKVGMTPPRLRKLDPARLSDLGTQPGVHKVGVSSAKPILIHCTRGGLDTKLAFVKVPLQRRQVLQAAREYFPRNERLSLDSLSIGDRQVTVGRDVDDLCAISKYLYATKGGKDDALTAHIVLQDKGIS